MPHNCTESVKMIENVHTSTHSGVSYQLEHQFGIDYQKEEHTDYRF